MATARYCYNASIYQACSAEAARVRFGEKTDSRILGVTDLDTPGKASEFADVFMAQDTKIIKTGLPLTVLNINYWGEDSHLGMVINYKKPYRNREGKIAGVILHAYELSGCFLAQMYRLIMAINRLGFLPNKMQSSHYLIGGHYDEAKLTTRETECLFYTLMGESTKQIATRIKRSSETVEMHIEHLKNKFMCHTKLELIAKAIESGFLSSIPKFFLSQPISLELSNTPIRF